MRMTTTNYFFEKLHLNVTYKQPQKEKNRKIENSIGKLTQFLILLLILYYLPTSVLNFLFLNRFSS